MCELMKQQETHLKQQVPSLGPILQGMTWNPPSRAGSVLAALRPWLILCSLWTCTVPMWW
ncbi:hypothetical protein P7K49_015887 [Saguinus oedipus]|uniref:Uncharacterized protein n=1 Tax=Saguinus oedipus TaxID=9490 RepID=A0ABQ9VCI2_SAGOE|nr:hypothetical protein P7K49_015887 [Saguinus oedipus]